MSEDPTRPPPLEYGTAATAPTRWRRVALWAMLAGVPLIGLSLLLVGLVDIEVILVSGPVLAIVGVLLIVAGTRLRDRFVLTGGLLHLAACGGTFALIFGLSLDKREAFALVVVVHGLYGVAFAALTVFWIARRFAPDSARRPPLFERSPPPTFEEKSRGDRL